MAGYHILNLLAFVYDPAGFRRRLFEVIEFERSQEENVHANANQQEFFRLQLWSNQLEVLSKQLHQNPKSIKLKQEFSDGFK